jgi:hypothetical protein
MRDDGMKLGLCVKGTAVSFEIIFLAPPGHVDDRVAAPVNFLIQAGKRR